ncbi:DUF4349 domain-containing protein [bacterium]|nr:DUF4349 domain-containing protein [bacterium]
MTRRPTEQLTPLEETLTHLPQEEAPEGLQDRCLAALDAAGPESSEEPESLEGPATSRPKRPIPWNHFAVAAAASLVIALVAMPLLLSPAKSPRQPIVSAEGPAGPSAAAQHTSSMAGGVMYEAADVPGMPERKPSAGAPGGPAAMPTSPAPARAARAPNATAAHKVMVGREDIDRLQPSATVPAVPPIAAGAEIRSVVPAPSQPWYDRSEGRQKISRRAMQIEAPDVEETYQQIVAAIEKAGGYIEREDLMVQKGQPDRATISARVPAAAFDAVVQQLRGLGKLLKLTGSSEDRTQEYKSRGADIRGLSAAEQDLMDHYARERNASRKQALKWELDSLRRTLHEEKQALLALAAETNFAYLDIQIVEGSSFWHSVKEKSADALPIAMAIALAALPFFVVGMMWRRRG